MAKLSRNDGELVLARSVSLAIPAEPPIITPFVSTFIFASVMLVGFAACASEPQTLQSAIAACAKGAQSQEMQTSGIITRVFGTRESINGRHEGFLFRTPIAVLHVEDNVDITGPIPLQRGDRITLQGQYECNDGVIHWTHHDPRFRHVGGYIEVNGKLYQ